MQVSLKWLKDYIDIRIPPHELAHRLTMGGVEVASFTSKEAAWDKVYVGMVAELRPHPNADRLQLVTADYGGRTITVVTGAFNIRVGDKVPVALAGATLIDGHGDGTTTITLKPTKMRGILSEGMVCSGKELGLSDDQAGILVLEPDAPVGMPLADYLGDVIFHFELTPNRSDCLSLLGIAREVAAIQRTHGAGGQPVAVRAPRLDYPETEPEVTSLVDLSIEDPDLCPRYSATVIRGVRVGESPRWLQDRLRSAGQRPINNVVDVTNYVMLETGQPLHAFDYDLIGGKRIIVRRARGGESIVSLDGVLRELTPDMLVIADARRPIAIAGVMGGLESEVTENTVNVLLESANFNPTSIRRTARALKIPSEAQKRFEKGLSPEGTVPAARRATRLIQELAGGQVAKGVADAFPMPCERQPVGLPVGEVKRLLGITLPVPEIVRALEALDFQCRVEADYVWAMPPYQRRDINIPADLVEEVARLLGYDRIPDTMLSGSMPTYEAPLELAWEEVTRDVLTGAGFSEVITYSLVNKQSTDKLLLGGSLVSSKDAAAAIARGGKAHLTPFIPLEAIDSLLGKEPPLLVANPLSAEAEALRTTTLVSMLETLERNLRHADRDVHLFELGRIYLPRGQDLPEERRVLTLAVGQYRTGRVWGVKEENDFFDLKGVLEALLGRMGIRAYRLVPAAHPTFHPGRTAVLAVSPKPSGSRRQVSREKEEVVGVLGEVHPKVRQNFDIKQRAYLLAVDFQKLTEFATTSRQHQPLPRFPAVVQDIALILDAAIPAEKVLGVILGAGGRLVKEARLFDVYQGEPIPPDKRSLAYSITYQAPECTLTDEEVAKAQQGIVSALNREFGAILRGPALGTY